MANTAWVISDTVKALLAIAEMLFGMHLYRKAKLAGKNEFVTRFILLTIAVAVFIFTWHITLHDPVNAGWEFRQGTMGTTLLLFGYCIWYTSLAITKAQYTAAKLTGSLPIYITSMVIAGKVSRF